MSRVPTEKEHAFLCMLAAGQSFEQAAEKIDAWVDAAGNADGGATKVLWECLLNGWIEQGCITKTGRELALKR